MNIIKSYIISLFTICNIKSFKIKYIYILYVNNEYIIGKTTNLKKLYNLKEILILYRRDDKKYNKKVLNKIIYNLLKEEKSINIINDILYENNFKIDTNIINKSDIDILNIIKTK
tara:strand:+ start:2983 stop:3327 length:345 start_codon:yes stop_codon:yes gene_type:complete